MFQILLWVTTLLLYQRNNNLHRQIFIYNTRSSFELLDNSGSTDDNLRGNLSLLKILSEIDEDVRTLVHESSKISFNNLKSSPDKTIRSKMVHCHSYGCYSIVRWILSGKV